MLTASWDYCSGMAWRVSHGGIALRNMIGQGSPFCSSHPAFFSLFAFPASLSCKGRKADGGLGIIEAI